ncbi:MAG: hypothetical protein AB8B81_01330 [Halioglobus sp.]
MSPEYIGIIIGIVFIVPTVYIINSKGFDDWAWPFFLVTLPIWYMLFGLLALDGTVIMQELLYGIPYLATGLFLWKINPEFRLTRPLLGIAWLSHGFYDYYHNWFFVNPGVFSWYPAFCAVVDIVVGVYLLSGGPNFGKTRSEYSN